MARILIVDDEGDLLAVLRDTLTKAGHEVFTASTPGHGLAEIVEAGEQGTPRARKAIRAALEREVNSGADTVVLGCTHYHFLAPDIEAEFPGLAIVDTSEPVARRARQVLDERGLAAPPGAHGSLDLIVTGNREEFRSRMERLGFAPGIPAAEAAS